MSAENYYDGVNHRLVELVPQEARRILDVGCAAGGLGAFLKAQRPDREVWGVEMVEDAARTAEQRLDRVLVGDVERLEMLPVPPDYFDCILFGDVLEHLVAPGPVLAGLRGHLAEGGQIACCVPNVAHWSVVMELLRGAFTYADNGLLDRTHLRFFTPASFRQLLVETGYDPVLTDTIKVDQAALTNALAEVSARFGVDPSVTRDATSTYQMLFRARPKVTQPSAAVFEPSPKATLGRSIVVVTYNSMQTIEGCLSRVLTTLGPADELLVVDNASTDGTRTLLEGIDGLHPRVRILCNDVNLGFSAGVNQAIRAAQGEYVVLLNPDTLVTAGWLDRLEAHFDAPDVGAVGPLSDYVAGLQRFDGHLPADAPFDGTVDVDDLAGFLAARNAGAGIENKLLIGFCLMIPRRVLDAEGLLDEDLFLGNDDLELSWRLRTRGYRLLVATDVFVQHTGQVSFSTLEDGQAQRLVQESTDVLARKLVDHYGPGNVPRPEELWGIGWFTPSVGIWSVVPDLV